MIAIDEDLDAFAAPVPDVKRDRVIGGVERLPITSASIDLVICNHALEHFQELEAASKKSRAFSNRPVGCISPSLTDIASPITFTVGYSRVADT